MDENDRLLELFITEFQDLVKRFNNHVNETDHSYQEVHFSNEFKKEVKKRFKVELEDHYPEDKTE